MGNLNKWKEALDYANSLRPANFQAKGSGFRAHFTPDGHVAVTAGLVDRIDALAFLEWLKAGLED